MVSKKIMVDNRVGIHARPASLFVKMAAGFQSNITVTKNEKKGNAKSIISILALGVGKGDEIVISAEGEDEGAAADALAELVLSKFGEE